MQRRYSGPKTDWRASSLPVFVFARSAHQLCHPVDVDLSLLQASAEEHGRRH